MDPARPPARDPGAPGIGRRLVPAWIALALVAAAAGGGSPGVAAGETTGARPVFETISRAWQTEDHAALAGLVAEEGVEIAITAQTGARNHYSSRQAFYFFKNLFRSTRTDAFRFSLLREDPEAGLVHAVADWSYRRSDSDDAQSERLFFTLKQGDSKWGLTAIRAIR